jgi:hypothetical protein
MSAFATQVNMALGKLEGQIKLIRDNMVMWGVQVSAALLSGFVNPFACTHQTSCTKAHQPMRF